MIAVFPLGGLFNFENSRGRLKERGPIREGSLFTKSDEKDIYDIFLVLLPHTLWIQHTILRVKYTKSTQFYPKPYQTCQLILLDTWNIFGNLLHFISGNGLDRERGLFKILAQRRGEGLIRGKSLTESREFIVLLRVVSLHEKVLR